MTRRTQRFLRRWTLAAYAIICLGLGLAMGLGLWAAYHDLRQLDQMTLRREVVRWRAHAHHVVGRIEGGLEQQPTPDLEHLAHEQHLPSYGGDASSRDDQPLFVAVIDGNGEILMHSDPQRTGRRLGRNWYDHVAPDAGPQVFEARSEVLTGGQPSYVIRLPILAGGDEVGEYLVGLDAARLEAESAARRRATLAWWGLILASVLAVELFALAALYFLLSRSQTLRVGLDAGRQRRLMELSQLAAGLAHEIRNPLHAIRLNLHALGRAMEGRAKLEPQDVLEINEQSNQEIDRVDRLLKSLVGFACPEAPRLEVVDLRDELRAGLDFLTQEMRRKNIEVVTDFPDQPARIQVDRGRLRQIVSQLLINAHDAVEVGGRIELSLRLGPRQVRLTVADNGRGIAEGDRGRVFEPFFSRKPEGTGLGLAIVQRFVEEADGQIYYEPNDGSGARFHVIFPNVDSLANKGHQG